MVAGVRVEISRGGWMDGLRTPCPGPEAPSSAAGPAVASEGCPLGSSSLVPTRRGCHTAGWWPPVWWQSAGAVWCCCWCAWLCPQGSRVAVGRAASTHRGLDAQSPVLVGLPGWAAGCGAGPGSARGSMRPVWARSTGEPHPIDCFSHRCPKDIDSCRPRGSWSAAAGSVGGDLCLGPGCLCRARGRAALGRKL